MSNRPAPWKIVTFGVALTGLGVAGAGVSIADDDRRTAVPESVSVAAVDGPADASPDVAAADASPESADSPTESVTDSPDAAPADDIVPADASPQSADSPAESAWDSADNATPDAAGDDLDSTDSPDGTDSPN